MWTVEVKSNDGWTTHSTHEKYRDAAEQADMVHGRLVDNRVGGCDLGGDWYVIFPDGGCWVAIDRSSGDMVEQANASSHIAASDKYAVICAMIRDEETDEHVPLDIADEVLAMWDPDADPILAAAAWPLVLPPAAAGLLGGIARVSRLNANWEIKTMAKAFWEHELIAESAEAPILSETGIDGDQYDTLRDAVIVADDESLQKWIDAADWWGQDKPTPAMLRSGITRDQAVTLPNLEWDEEWQGGSE